MRLEAPRKINGWARCATRRPPWRVAPRSGGSVIRSASRAGSPRSTRFKYSLANHLRFVEELLVGVNLRLVIISFYYVLQLLLIVLGILSLAHDPALDQNLGPECRGYGISVIAQNISSSPLGVMTMPYFKPGRAAPPRDTMYLAEATKVRRKLRDPVDDGMRREVGGNTRWASTTGGGRFRVDLISEGVHVHGVEEGPLLWVEAPAPAAFLHSVQKALVFVVYLTWTFIVTWRSFPPHLFRSGSLAVEERLGLREDVVITIICGPDEAGID